MKDAIGTPPDNDEVHRALDRVLASANFDASDRNRQFLRYIVEETLAGRQDRIKAYAIATAVFGRHASFDPQTDPIVRIEARRLRRSLERYYLIAGEGEPITISIPKGDTSRSSTRGPVRHRRPRSWWADALPSGCGARSGSRRRSELRRSMCVGTRRRPSGRVAPSPGRSPWPSRGSRQLSS
jgi:hypothetical protein